MKEEYKGFTAFVLNSSAHQQCSSNSLVQTKKLYVKVWLHQTFLINIIPNFRSKENGKLLEREQLSKEQHRQASCIVSIADF